jgi:hypothetical protein
VIRRIESWLYRPGDPRRLAAARIGLSSVLAVRLSRGVYASLAGQAAALYRPLSFMHVFPRMPSHGVTVAVQLVGVAAAILSVIGWRARWALPVAWASGVFLNGMATSVGKVVHNDVLLLLAIVPLLVAPTAAVWSLDARRAGRRTSDVASGPAFGWPIRTAMVVVAGSYLFTGLAKLEFSGPAWAFGSNLRWVLYAASDGHAHPNGLALFVADRPLLAHALAVMTLVIELGFPLVLFRPRSSWFFVPGVVALHLGIWATMGLDYSAWIATVLVVFVDWPALMATTSVVAARTSTVAEGQGEIATNGAVVPVR